MGENIEAANSHVNVGLDLKGKTMDEQVNNRDLWMYFQIIMAVPFITYLMFAKANGNMPVLAILLVCLCVCLLMPYFYWSARKAGGGKLNNIHSFLQVEKLKLEKQIKITKYGIWATVSSPVIIVFMLVGPVIVGVFNVDKALKALPVLIVGGPVMYWWYI